MDSWRRASHGGSGFARDQRMRQPQDGALDLSTRVASITSKMHPALPMEPEDARLTGATRSLFRRVMGLNVMRTSEQLEAPTLAQGVSRKPQARPLVSSRTSRAQVA